MREKRKTSSIDYHINETTTMETGTPVDYSFKKLKVLQAVGVEGPRATRMGKVPERGSEHRRYLTRSIWLNNNKLTKIANMELFVNSVLEQPEKLGWIDFSFNFITELDESILQFPNLKIVYFHGNLIEDMDQILKLRNLTKLRSITFHGNPISENPRYRMYPIAYLPQVVNLDFSPVTIAERRNAHPPDAVKKIQVLEPKSEN